MAESDKYFCEMCQLWLAKYNQESHEQGKKHQLKAHKHHLTNRKEKCSVFITGFPNLVTKDSLSDFFKKLGPVLEYYIGEGNRYAIVQFKTAEAAEGVLKKRPTFMGRVLSVKPRILRDPPDKPDTAEESESTFEQLIGILRNVTGFHQQMSVLMDCIHPQNMHAQYLHLCIDLENVLSTIFPICKAHPFGSTVSGLDFKGSDVDCYIHVPYSPNDGQNRRAQNLVTEARRAMLKSKQFTKVVAIPKAKTPIVKCVHVPTNICCDFNFKNMLGVCNTNLISNYLSIACTLKPTVIFLKCWGKMHGFIGASGKFSSYAITMMFIYYLQQAPYFAQSVWDLQCVPELDNIQEDWNGGFAQVSAKNYAIKKARLQDLLRGFFNFYAKFEYSLYVVSPFLGKPILKTEFLKPSFLPARFIRYKNNLRDKEPLQVETPICLQDPFELNHNVTRAVSPRFLEEFVAYCKRASSIIAARLGDLCLYQLLSEDVDDVKYVVNSGTCCFKIPAGSSLAYLESKLNSASTDKPRDLQNVWFENTMKFLIRVIGNVFKFDISVNSDAPDVNGSVHKAIRLSGQKDVHDNNVVDDVRLVCKGSVNLWEARRSISRDLHEADGIHGVLEKQIFISDYIANDLLQGKVSKEHLLGFDVKLNAIIDPTCMEVNIGNVSDPKNMFVGFCQFLVSKVLLWFETYEKQMNAAMKDEGTSGKADK